MTTSVEAPAIFFNGPGRGSVSFVAGIPKLAVFCPTLSNRNGKKKTTTTGLGWSVGNEAKEYANFFEGF